MRRPKHIPSAYERARKTPIPPKQYERFARDLDTVVGEKTFARRTLGSQIVIYGLSIVMVLIVFGLFYLSEEVLPRAPLPQVRREATKDFDNGGLIYVTPYETEADAEKPQ